jgi:hypothetical protein
MVEYVGSPEFDDLLVRALRLEVGRSARRR